MPLRWSWARRFTHPARPPQAHLLVCMMVGILLDTPVRIKEAAKALIQYTQNQNCMRLIGEKIHHPGRDLGALVLMRL